MSAARARRGEGGGTNEVVLEGRLSGQPERRTLPSGDELVSLRLVVRRDEGGVDTFPVAVGPAPPLGVRPARGQIGRRLLAAAALLPPDGLVRVEGSLRRRWWRDGGTPQSLIEVRARAVEPLGAAGA